MSETDTRVWHSDEDFIAAWQSAGTAEEVAENLGLKLASVHARSRHMRENGVPLKEHPRNTRTQKKDEAYWALMANIARAALPTSDETSE